MNPEPDAELLRVVVMCKPCGRVVFELFDLDNPSAHGWTTDESVMGYWTPSTDQVRRSARPRRMIMWDTFDGFRPPRPRCPRHGDLPLPDTQLSAAVAKARSMNKPVTLRVMRNATV